MVLQLLDKARKFGVMELFLVNNLEPIWDKEGERKKGSFVFMLPRKSVNNHIFFALPVNDLIITSK